MFFQLDELLFLFACRLKSETQENLRSPNETDNKFTQNKKNGSVCGNNS